MNNKIEIFKNAEFGELKTVIIDNEPWFVGKDVVNILGYQNGSRDINRHVDEEDRQRTKIEYAGQLREMTVINESGLYSLVLSSKLPAAKTFKRWITSEVLPAIRKHGVYAISAQDSYMIADPIERAKRWIEEQQERKELLETTKKQEQVILELKPKADYTDDILQNKGVVAITQIAKDYGMSGKAMNAKLHELGIIYKLGEQWLLYSKYQSCGYTHSETVAIKHTDGRSDVKLNTKWTQKGRLFLYNKLKCHGVLPMIEMIEI